MINIVMKPSEKSIGLDRSMEPFHSVPIQLNILTPVGTAMAMVVRANTEFATGPSPTVNMWWLQTIQPMNPMITPESTTTGYPNSGFLEKVGTISEIMPMAGSMRMYTSGCPKIQNRCCQSIGLAPAAGTKKFAPKNRSNISSIRATVITGNASTRRNEVTRVIQVNRGMRMRDIPGARMLTMVTMKLKAAAREAIPRIWRLTTQKSMPWAGLYAEPVIGA